jgi:signal transduction histidine kinase
MEFMESGPEPDPLARIAPSDELARARRELGRISEQLLHVQEDERQRIAIELHDSTCQHLAVLSLGLARLKGLTRGARRKEILEEMSLSLAEASKETRILSYLMKPNGLSREGLVATAGRFAEGFSRRTGLAVCFRVDGPVDAAAADVQHAAFRIVQEALANVHRHAEATSVDVELCLRDATLTVLVADNGLGFRHGHGGTSDDVSLGVGIWGMRVRVEQLGGQLEIGNREIGARVLATLPIDGPV